jgi:HTH-type transcriptional regulator/antitoxin MqsA
MNESANHMESPQCLACGEGTLQPRTEYNPVEVCGQTMRLPLQYSVCDHCGAELTNTAQSQANKRARVVAEKQTQGLLEGGRIRAFRKQCKLNQQEAAQIFGGGNVEFSRYENDDIVQSQAMDSLLRLCMAQPHNLITLATMRQVPLQNTTLQDIHAHAHLQMLAIAPKVQQLLENAMAQQRKQQAIIASNDWPHEKFVTTERSVWRARA